MVTLYNEQPIWHIYYTHSSANANGGPLSSRQQTDRQFALFLFAALQCERLYLYVLAEKQMCNYEASLYYAGGAYITAWNAFQNGSSEGLNLHCALHICTHTCKPLSQQSCATSTSLSKPIWRTEWWNERVTIYHRITHTRIHLPLLRLSLLLLMTPKEE